jgi:hypothetical protein
MNVIVVSEPSDSVSGEPHDAQKFDPSGLRWPQFVQNMGLTL